MVKNANNRRPAFTLAQPPKDGNVRLVDTVEQAVRTAEPEAEPSQPEAPKTVTGGRTPMPDYQTVQATTRTTGVPVDPAPERRLVVYPPNRRKNVRELEIDDKQIVKIAFRVPKETSILLRVTAAQNDILARDLLDELIQDGLGRGNFDVDAFVQRLNDEGYWD